MTEEKPKSEPEEIADIQAMNIHFFPNNTFSTYGGVSGDHTKILRGKWAIIGYDHDQLWMQVLRFGFGREVSGSTYRYVMMYLIYMDIYVCSI